MDAQDQKMQLQKLYEGWLSQTNWKIERSQNQSVFSELIIAHPSKVSISISQTQETIDRIDIISQVTIAADAQELIVAWPIQQKMTFENEIKQALILAGIQFVFVYEDTKLKVIRIAKGIYGEGLTKQIFFDNCQKIIDGIILVLTILGNRLGQHAAQNSKIPEIEKTVRPPYG